MLRNGFTINNITYDRSDVDAIMCKWSSVALL